ncbi:MAG: ABC transporter ATP-binding protein [Chthoniobacteraceae bacterium]
MSEAIRLDNLKKAFAGKPALHGVSFSVERGEIFGLLGHNGAGKSTALGILLGQVFPDSGEAFVGGISVQRERARALARVGAIFEAPRFYDYLSGWRNLEIFTSYSAIVSRKEMQDAVEFVGLTARIHDKVGAYSQGMRQRLGVAQALLPEPELVLLDEPTNGLDPEGIAEMRALIQRLNRERGFTVLFCSHLLSEVEQLCDRVAILNQGRLIYTGRWHELAPKGARFRIDAEPWEKAVLHLNGAPVIEPGLIELPLGADIADLVTRLVQAGLKVRAVTPEKQTLEQLYLREVQK